MSQHLKLFSVAILVVGLAAATLLYTGAASPWQPLGIVLIVAGAAVIIASRQLAAKNASNIDLKPLAGWSGTLRPFTIFLWGIGLVILGLSYLLGL